MKRNHKIQFNSLVFVLSAFTASVQAQSDEKLAAALTSDDEPSLNHFGAAFRMGFNLKPSFKNIGGVPEFIFRDPGRPQDRTYTDGYVRTDATGNDHSDPDNPATAPYNDTTWFWAYADRSTQTDPMPGSVLMHSDFSSPITSTKGEKDDPLPGFELTYNRQLGSLGKARWGVEAAFGYMSFDFRNQGSYPVAVGRRTDQYDFPPSPGENPPKEPGFPLDPYGGQGAGTFNGPGQLLGDAVMGSVVDQDFGSTLAVGERRFDGDLFSGRLGPYMEIPLCRKSSIWLSGGLALVGVQSDFEYNESVTIAGVGTEGHSASGSNGDVLVGYYVSGSLSMALTSRLGLFGGVQYQSAGTYTHPLDSVGTYTQLLDRKAAELDLRDTFFVTVGLSCSF